MPGKAPIRRRAGSARGMRFPSRAPSRAAPPPARFERHAFCRPRRLVCRSRIADAPARAPARTNIMRTVAATPGGRRNSPDSGAAAGSYRSGARSAADAARTYRTLSCSWRYPCRALSVSRTAKPAGASRARGEFLDDFESHLHDGYEYHLCDAVARVDREWRGAAIP